MALACTSAAPCRRILGGKRWLGGTSCQGRQPPKAGAAGPPLQGLPPSHTRPPRSTAGNISSAGCLKTGPQYTQHMAEHAPSIFAGVCFDFANDGAAPDLFSTASARVPSLPSPNPPPSSQVNT